MKSTCLLCSLQRMYDGWTKLISNVQPPMKAAPWPWPTAMSAKSAFQILTGLTVQQRRAKTFFGGTLGETFEAFAIESDLRLSRRKDRERLLKICNNRQSSQFVCGAVCGGARCNLQHDGWSRSKLNLNVTRDPAKALRPRDLKIDSGEKSFPLEVANQLARYF